MAEQSEKTEVAEAPTGWQVAAARRFVERHDKPSKAVVEHIGRVGARMVLVGAGGALGDVVGASVPVGEKLVEAVEGLEPATWDSETVNATAVNATAIGAKHRRRMAGRCARQ